MKKLVFGLVATVAFSFSGFAASDVVNNEKVEIMDINIAKSELYYSNVFGICNIRIIDNRTGETVYQISLLANDAEACKRMCAQTLEAYVEGNL